LQNILVKLTQNHIDPMFRTVSHCTVLVLVDLQLAFRGRRPRTGRLPGLTFSHLLMNEERRVTND